MALIYCSECSAEVSDKAYDCPKCGAPLRKPKRTLFGRFIKWVFIAFNIVFLFVLIVVRASEKSIEDLTKEDFNKAMIRQMSGQSPPGSIEEQTVAILVFWFMGVCLLGLLLYFTRPTKNR